MQPRVRATTTSGAVSSEVGPVVAARPAASSEVGRAFAPRPKVSTGRALHCERLQLLLALSACALGLSPACATSHPVAASVAPDVAIGDPVRRARHLPLVLDGITDTQSGEIISAAEMAARLDGTRLVFAGETHTSAAAHEAQRRLLEALVERGREVLIGLEMLPKSAQTALDAFVAGEISEPELLRATRWFTAWGHSFHLYRDIFLLARDRRLRMFGVNVPRELVTAVRKKGLGGLTPAEAAHLPRAIDTKSPAADEHRRLFRALVGADSHGGSHGDMTEAQWEAMFQAQCTWDAGMSWNATKALLNHGGPNAIMVVLIGAGHVVYGLGAERQAAGFWRGPIGSLIPVPVVDDARRPIAQVRASYARFVWGIPPEDPLAVFPVLGVALQDEPARDAVSGPAPVSPARGLLVSLVAPGSAAANAGVQVGDRLLGLDGASIRVREDLQALLLGKRWGDAVQIDLLRGQNRLKVQAYLRRRLAEETP